MARKRIRLLDANFRGATLKLGSSCLTTVTVSARFDQLVADQMGLKEVYKRRNEEDAEVRTWGLDLEMVAASLIIRPKQATTDGRIKIDNELRFGSLKVDSFVVKKHKNDEQCLISFHFAMIDEDAAMHQAMHAMRKDPFDCDIQPGNATAVKAAEAQLRLISKSVPEETEAVNETAEVEA